MEVDTPPEQYIAKYILEHNKIYTLIETDEFCRYNRGIFHRGKEAASEIREQITELANKILIGSEKTLRPYHCSIAKRNEITEQIKSATFISLVEFETDERRALVENGEIFIRNKLMEPGLFEECRSWDAFEQEGVYVINDYTTFSRHFNYDENPSRSFTKIPVRYDPKAECLAIDQFLIDVFGFDKVPLIYEMIGYFLMPTIRYQKAFILYGSQNSGKTTFIEMLMRFFGGTNPGRVISQVKLHRLSKRFQVVNLMGKILNIFDDLPHNTLRHSDIFRIVVTNKYLQGEKKHAGFIDWINRCKQLYTCNDLPPVSKEMGDADWRRWIIIPCFSEFKDKDKMTEEDYNNPFVFEKDPLILDKLCTEEEFSGLLNKIIEGYTRLMERKHFPAEWDDIEKVKGLWQMDVNPVKLFVDECCEVGDTYIYDYYDFQRQLTAFRESYGYKGITPTMCTQSLRKINDKIERSKNRQSYHGIKIVKKVIGDISAEPVSEADIEEVERIILGTSASKKEAKRESIVEYVERMDGMFKGKRSDPEDEKWHSEF